MAWKFFTSAGKEKIIEEVVPAGLILPFAGATAPSGWLICSGAEVSRTTYPLLDAAIGQNFGTYTNGSGAAGTTHMRLPDLRGRTPVGYQAGSGDTTYGLSGNGYIPGYGSSIAANQLGAWAGSETVTLTAAQSGRKAHGHSASVASHTHTITQTNHSHTVGYATDAVYDSGSANGTSTFYVRAQGNGSSTTNVNAQVGMNPSGGNQTFSYTTTRSNSDTNASSSHSNIMSSLVINFMIRAI